ncbi:MAG TPA: rhodanese-like domain-containing protein [Chitinophagaceae bacterium]
MASLRTIFITLLGNLMFIAASCQVVDSNAISNEQFREATAGGKSAILDVRTAEEYREGHIPGAINYDVLDEENFKKQLSALPKDKAYVLYCRSGKRSLTALRIMKEQGFPDVKHLRDGIKGWDGEVVQ